MEIPKEPRHFHDGTKGTNRFGMPLYFDNCWIPERDDTKTQFNKQTKRKRH